MEKTMEKLKQCSPLKVCAYIRSKPQSPDSMDFQTERYEKMLSEVQGWTSAGIYRDTVLNGEELSRMLDDCRSGKIDLIITKSVSRFARNGEALKKILRELKELSVGVFFELENLYTLDENDARMINLLLCM